MKKIFKSLFITFTVLGFFSCVDTLDKEPLGIMSDSNVWNNDETAKAFLFGPYRQMCFMFMETSSTSEYWPLMWGLDNMMAVSDECTSWWLTEGTANWQTGETVLTTGNPFDDMFDDAYRQIRSLNIMINRMQEYSTLPEETKQLNIARARWARAMYYFALVKRYGGVPLITEEQWITDPYDELYPKRTPEKDIYDFIIKEADEIFEHLPDYEAVGLPNKWAALAMKSRAALFAGSIAKYGTVQLDGILGIPANEANAYFQKSYDASDQLIESGKFLLYNKYPDDKVKNFSALFLDEGNSEVIFYFPFIGQGYNQPNSGYDMHFGPFSKVAWGGSKAQPFLETVEWFENKDGSPGTFDRTKFTTPGSLWSYEELWGKKDPRFFASIFTMETPWQGDIVKMYNGIIREDGTLSEGTDNFYNGLNSMGPDARESRGKTGFSIKKYLEESRIRPDNYQSDQDWPSIRLAEIKLNKAEAAIELGKTGDALQEVNDIRDRAGIAQLTSIDLEKVRNERRVELAFEGFRFFDLRRWRIADKVIDTRIRQYTNLRYILDYKSTQTGEAWKYRIQLVNSGNDDLYKIFDPKLYYYPITQRRISNNKNLVENPGY